MTTTRSLVLRPHEADRLAKHGEVLIVRVMKPQPIDASFGDYRNGNDWDRFRDNMAARLHNAAIRCPFSVGDEMAVKETWQAVPVGELRDWRGIPEGRFRVPEPHRPSIAAIYRADGPMPGDEIWRSAVTMPKWASRFTVRVESVACRRIRNITDKDAKRMGHEGIPYKDDHDVHHDGHRAEFMRVVGKIHGPAAWADDVHCWFGAMRRIDPC